MSFWLRGGPQGFAPPGGGCDESDSVVGPNGFEAAFGAPIGCGGGGAPNGLPEKSMVEVREKQMKEEAFVAVRTMDACDDRAEMTVENKFGSRDGGIRKSQMSPVKGLFRYIGFVVAT